MILAAEFPAIPSSAVKIASEQRCAILVHSDLDMHERYFIELVNVKTTCWLHVKTISNCFQSSYVSINSPNMSQESPRQTKRKKGPKQKVHEFRPFLWILVFFLRKTSTIHIELLFRNAPMNWPFLGLVCRGHSWMRVTTPHVSDTCMRFCF